MKVLVCLEATTPSQSGRAALALACTLTGAGEVLVLSAGGLAASPTLDLACTCPGVARVLHLEDPALDQADFMTMGMVLAEAARHLGAGLVLTGERSDEEGQGLVPAALAHHLHAHRLARVCSVRLGTTPEHVEVTLRAGGQICTLLCPLPLVLTTGPGPDLLGGPSADAPRTVESLSLAQIGLDASRLVPRPDLLGILVPGSPVAMRELSIEEAAVALARHH